MAGKFTLNAQIKLLAPTNSATILNQIKAQLQGLNVPITINTKGVNQQLQNIVKGTSQVSKSAQAASNDIEKLGAEAARSLRRFSVFTIATAGVYKFSQALSAGIKDALDFSREMTKLQQVTGQSEKSLKGLSNEVTRLAVEFGYSSTKILDVAVTLSQAGLSAKDTKVALEALTKTGVAATFGTIKETTEASIAIMNQFGKKAQDLEGILGSVNRVAGEFAVEAEDIGVAVRRAGSTFAAAGGNFHEFQALFTSIRQTTRASAESIATGLRTIEARLQRPRTQNFLSSIGIELLDSKKQFIGLYAAVEKLHTGLSGLQRTDPRFAQIAEELGGYRQLDKIIPLIEQFGVAQKALNTSMKGANSLSADAAVFQDTLAHKIQSVNEQFQALIRNVTGDPFFKGMINGTLALATAFIKLTDAVRPFAAVFAAIGLAKIVPQLTSLRKGFSSNIISPGAKRFASGGKVHGSGSGDTVPAMLTPGEFVMNTRAVKNAGSDKLAAMNAGVQFFASGSKAPVRNKGESAKDFFRRVKGYEIYEREKRDREEFDSDGRGTRAYGSYTGSPKRKKATTANVPYEPPVASPTPTPTGRTAVVMRNGVPVTITLGKATIKSTKTDVDTPKVEIPKLGYTPPKLLGHTPSEPQIPRLGHTPIKRLGYTPPNVPTTPSAPIPYALDRANIEKVIQELHSFGVDVKKYVSKIIIRDDIPSAPGTYTNGQYYTRTGEVHLNKKRLTDYNKLRETFTHEVGHGIDVSAHPSGRYGFGSDIAGTKGNQIAGKYLKDNYPRLNAKYGYDPKYRDSNTENFTRSFTSDVLEMVNGAKKSLGKYLGTIYNSFKHSSIPIEDELGISLPSPTTPVVPKPIPTPLPKPGRPIDSPLPPRRKGPGTLPKRNGPTPPRRRYPIGPGGVVPPRRPTGPGGPRKPLGPNSPGGRNRPPRRPPGPPRPPRRPPGPPAPPYGPFPSYGPTAPEDDSIRRRPQGNSIFNPIVLGTLAIAASELVGQFGKSTGELKKWTDFLSNTTSKLVALGAAVYGISTFLSSIKSAKEGTGGNPIANYLDANQNGRARASKLAVLKANRAARDADYLANSGIGINPNASIHAGFDKDGNSITVADPNKTRRISHLTKAQRKKATTAQLEKANRAARLTQVAQGGTILAGGALLAGGSYLSSKGDAAIAEGTDKTGTNSLIGGALSGAGTGLAAGAIFGPWGAAIGASTGLLAGFGISLLDVTDKLKAVQLEKSLSELSHKINSVASGKLAFSTNRASGVAGLLEQKKEFESSTSSAEVKQQIKASITQSSTGIQDFFDKIAKESKTLEEFEKETRGALYFFSKVTNVPYTELEDGIVKTIKASKIQLANTDKVNKSLEIQAARISAFDALINGINETEAKLSGFGNALERMSSSIDFNIGSFKQANTSDLFKNALNGSAGESFFRANNALGNGLGANGQIIAGEAEDAAKAIKELPNLLIATRQEDPLGKGENFTDRLLSKFDKLNGGRGIGGSARNSIEGALSSIIQKNDGKEQPVLDRVRFNVKELADELGKEIGIAIEEMAKLEPSIKDHVGKIINSFEAYNKAQNKITDLSVKSLNRQFEVEDIIHEVRGNGRPQSLEQLQGRESLTAIRIGGSDNVNVLSDALAKAQEQIKKFDDELKYAQLDVARSNEILKKRSAAELEANNAGKALHFLAFEAKNLGNIQKHIAEEQKKAAYNKNIAETLIFGNRDEKRQAGQTIAFSAVAEKFGIQNVPENKRRDVAEHLKSSNPELFDKLFGEGLRNKGFNGETSDRLVNGTNVKIDELIVELNKAAAEQQNASDAISKNVAKQGKDIQTALEAANKTFLAGLREALIERLVSDKKSQLDNNIATIEGNNQLLGRGRSILKGAGLNGEIDEAARADIAGAADYGKKLLEARKKRRQFEVESGLEISKIKPDFRTVSTELGDSNTPVDINEGKKQALIAQQAEKRKGLVRDEKDAERAFKGNRFESKFTGQSIDNLEILVKEYGDFSKDFEGKIEKVLVQQNTALTTFNNNTSKIIEKLSPTVSNETAINGGPVMSHASGGMVGGKGTGKSDSNLAWLSKGEFVINADAAQKIGYAKLGMLNDGNIPKLVNGGIVKERARRAKIREEARTGLADIQYAQEFDNSKSAARAAPNYEKLKDQHQYNEIVRRNKPGQRSRDDVKASLAKKQELNDKHADDMKRGFRIGPEFRTDDYTYNEPQKQANLTPAQMDARRTPQQVARDNRVIQIREDRKNDINQRKAAKGVGINILEQQKAGFIGPKTQSSTGTINSTPSGLTSNTGPSSGISNVSDKIKANGKNVHKQIAGEGPAPSVGGISSEQMTKFSDSVKKFSEDLTKITTALTSAEIKVNYNGKIEVVFNGLQALESLKKEIKTIAVKQAYDAVGDYYNQMVQQGETRTFDDSKKNDGAKE